MSSNEILDDFTERQQRRRLTPFQRVVRILSFFTWVAFLVGLLFKMESLPGSTFLFTPAFVVLAVIYLFLPVPLFRSKNWYQHLASHWVGAMMLSFLFGLYLRLESWPHGTTLYYVAGIGSALGLLCLLFLLIKKVWSQDERRFWTSMVVRLAIVLLLTSDVIIRLLAWVLR